MPEERTHTLKERALHPLRRTRHQTFQALKDISFEVRRGEFFGIAGRNGSGKSTLLKCLAGIYGVDSGQIWMNGRLSTFIELGVGFNQDLAARDNVVLNGIMMGLSPREARGALRRGASTSPNCASSRSSSSRTTPRACTCASRSPSRSRSTPTSCWSTRCSRSATPPSSRSASTCSTACATRAARSCSSPTTWASLNRFCHRALLLERGAMVHLGEPHEVADRYLEINFGRDPRGRPATRRTSAAATARRASSRPGSRTSTASASLAAPRASGSTLKALVRFMVDVEDPAASVYVLNEDHVAILVATSAREHERSGRFAAGEEALFSFAFENVLAPGPLQPAVHARPPRHGPGPDGPLRGRLLVRGHRARGAWAGWSTCRSRSGVERSATRSERARRAEQVRALELPPSAVARTRASGRPDRGPRALTDDWSRFWHLTYNIARNEFKLRFFGSVLGYVWQLMRPLLLFGVLYVFFVADRQSRQAARTPRRQFYGAQLLGSIVLFTFFAEATGGAVRSVVDRENLVRKIQFPRMVIPLSIVLLALLQPGAEPGRRAGLRAARRRHARCSAGSSCR